ncbi:LysR substrate-binding domain-containing protein [Marinobacterium jannaschii]|uniref:LysR substrate-binding domain-containing protein n=1 Tax=Marinobacterium jannaschii TaxID=64970 RepID=UPI0012EC6B41|nr:LysR substrate-binding domain-containing protein [Marinobacterium jannaschii]
MSEIRAFNATVRCGNFTRAAAELGVSQPAVTSQIQKLETRFSAEIFQRVSKGVRLTRLGLKLYQLTRQYDDLESSIRALANPETQLEKPELKLATSSPRIFMPLIARYKALFPRVELKIVYGSTQECRQMLLGREVDIGLFPLESPEPKEPNLSSLSFHRHRLVAILPVEHPLSARETVSVHELIEQPLIFLRNNSYTQELVEKIFAVNNLTPRPDILMNSRQHMCEAVSYGLGLGFSLSGDIYSSPGYCCVAITEVAEETTEHIVWLKARGQIPEVQDFVNIALDQLYQQQKDQAE